MTAVERVDGLLREFRRRYPDALGVCNLLIDSASVEWPEWCWLPMAGVLEYLRQSGAGPVDVARVSALAAWRLGRGVYELDAAVADAAVGELHESAGGDATAWERAVLPPVEMWAQRLPEWCCYVEWPAEAVPPGFRESDLDRMLVPLGVFVHLEHDINTGRPELRLLLDTDGTWDGLTGVPVYLDRPTLGAAIADMEGAALASARGARGANVRSLAGPETEIGLITWAVSPVLLALIDPAAQFVGPHAAGPERAERRGARWAPAAQTRVWRVTYSGPRRLRLVPR